MSPRRIAAVTLIVLSVVSVGYFAARWIAETTTPLSPASARLVGIFKDNAPRVAEQRVPLLVVENLICGSFSPQELDDAVSSPIPFFWEQEKRMEEGNQVWRFARWDLSGHFTLRVVMDAVGDKGACQASIRKG
jgi:hypothetical protein